MKQFLVLSLVICIFAVLSSSCSEAEKIRVLSAESKIASSEELDALKLQISISRNLWCRAGKSYTDEAKEELAAAGRAADEIASDPTSAPEQLEAARKALKDATTVFKNSIVGEADLISLAEVILKAEELLNGEGSDDETVSKIEAEIKKAYAVYSTNSSAVEVREALTSLETLLE